MLGLKVQINSLKHIPFLLAKAIWRRQRSTSSGNIERRHSIGLYRLQTKTIREDGRPAKTYDMEFDKAFPKTSKGEDRFELLKKGLCEYPTIWITKITKRRSGLPERAECSFLRKLTERFVGSRLRALRNRNSLISFFTVFVIKILLLGLVTVNPYVGVSFQCFLYSIFKLFPEPQGQISLRFASLSFFLKFLKDTSNSHFFHTGNSKHSKNDQLHHSYSWSFCSPVFFIL